MDTFQFLIPTENLDAALLLLSKELNHSEFTAKTGLTFADSVITYGGTEYAFPTLISDNSKQKAVNWGGDEAGSRASIDSCLWVGSGNVISADPPPSATREQTSYDLLQFEIGCEIGKTHCNLGIGIYWGQCSGLLEEDGDFLSMECGLAKLAKYEIVAYDTVGEVMIKPSGESDKYSDWLEWLDDNELDVPQVDEQVTSFETFLNNHPKG